ncbi:MAG: hypothetical protein LQ345_002728 [Seirophora villosa]|nr:MAG: hypothetical protein LQ345_002728 [Seirophora villosa]
MEGLHSCHVLGNDHRSQQRQPSVFATSLPRDQLSPKALTAAIVQHLGNLQEHIEDPEYQNFIQDLTSALGDSLRQPQKAAPIVDSLRHSFIEQGLPGLKTQLKYAFHGYLANRRFSKINLQDQARVADIRYPVEWYPKTRQMQRMIHLHVGPTNSGKTYHALKRLEQAQVGLYAGPLRLLAHEVYTRLKASGKPCNLITGDERQIAEADGVSMSSCTVEMVPVNADFDVAVVDEIQMIGHEERGWAWTQAVLGLKAKELHLCGEERTVPLIKELAAAMGDDLQIHHYQRLSPLKTMSASLKGDLGSLRKGDCVLAFSKVQIHKIKREIEIRTKKPVAVVYGSLPPEIRAQQAQLFNDPNNDYDILVASDAIGMGLNLSIKRIIFTTTRKFNGRSEVPVQIAQIKQIAGRAGRYRTAAQATAPDIIAKDLTGLEAKSRTGSPVISPAKTLGLVTTLHQGDLSALRTAMENQADPIMSAGLLPPVNVLVRFAAYFPPSTPLSYILLSLHNKSILHPRFHLCSQQDHLLIADTIEPVKNLTISDRIIFCASPASLKDDTQRPVLRAFAECVGNKGGGGILDIRALDLELLNQQVIVGSKDYLQKLESLHKSLILYLWLSYRFAGIFSTQALAFYVKSLVEEKIQQTLSQASATIRHVASGSRLGDVQGHLGTLNLQLAKADDDRNGTDQGLGAPHLPRHNVFRKEDTSTVKGKTPTKSSIGLDVTIPDLIPHPQPWGRDSPP